MGCAYTGNAGGAIRTEMPIPIPICADAGVESDSTETDNIKTPKTPTPNLRTERFIFIAFPWLDQFGLIQSDLINLARAVTRPDYVTAI
jgi:hypothetical protein